MHFEQKLMHQQEAQAEAGLISQCTRLYGADGTRILKFRRPAA